MGTLGLLNKSSHHRGPEIKEADKLNSSSRGKHTHSSFRMMGLLTTVSEGGGIRSKKEKRQREMCMCVHACVRERMFLNDLT